MTDFSDSSVRSRLASSAIGGLEGERSQAEDAGV